MGTTRTAERPVARVGIFGGTFDPPHRGHVSVARDVADALELDRVLWMPAGVPPHKTDVEVSPALTRLAMVRAAIDGETLFEASTLEIERAGPSYTVDTVMALREDLPDAELFVILGVDQFAELDSWHAPDRIRRNARFAVMDRAGRSAGVGEADARAVFVPVGRVDVSSTEVRERVERGEDVSDLVPEGVRVIIEAEGLYRSR